MMMEPKEEWEETLLYPTPQINSRIIMHLGYSSIKIITEI